VEFYVCAVPSLQKQKQNQMQIRLLADEIQKFNFVIIENQVLLEPGSHAHSAPQHRMLALNRI
jgi:hypothetical protein